MGVIANRTLGLAERLCHANPAAKDLWTAWRIASLAMTHLATLVRGLLPPPVVLDRNECLEFVEGLVAQVA